MKSQSKFISCSLQTGANVPEKLKNQIWGGKYIDFHLLLENDGNKFKFQFEMEGNNPEFSLVEEKQRKPLTLSRWLMALNKFTASICINKPELGPLPPHHIKLTLEMSREKGNWQYYDSEFRKLVEKGEAQWGSTHLELYLRARLKNLSSESQRNSFSNNPRWLQGVCFSFHRGTGCKFGNNCKYQHKCFNCGFNHSFSLCSKPVTQPFKFQPSNRNVGLQAQPFRTEFGRAKNFTDNKQSKVLPTPTSSNPKTINTSK